MLKSTGTKQSIAIGGVLVQFRTIKVNERPLYAQPHSVYCVLTCYSPFVHSLYLDDYANSELKEQIDAICPAGKSSNVWLDFCIESYMVDIDGQKERRFRVFDTELKIH